VASSHSCFVPFFGLQHELKVRLYMAIDEVGIVLLVAIVVVCNSESVLFFDRYEDGNFPTDNFFDEGKYREENQKLVYHIIFQKSNPQVKNS
jgi:hypothetical protein